MKEQKVLDREDLLWVIFERSERNVTPNVYSRLLGIVVVMPNLPPLTTQLDALR